MTKHALTLPDARSLSAVQKDFARYGDQAFPKRSAAFFALEMAGECGELANYEKKLWRDPNRDVNHDELAHEAADVFIALANYCNVRGIDLGEAITEKLVIIEKRRLQGLMGPIPSVS